MATNKRTFDAVAESRRWKTDVARKTRGLSAKQLSDFFDRDKALARIRAWRKKAARPVTAH
jgi:hypothetical protein